MPRILVISNNFPNAYKPYAAKYVQRHVELHRLSGFDMQVLAATDSRPGPAHALRKHALLLLGVLKTLMTGRFDLVHAHWPFPAGAYGLLLALLRRRPLITTSHGAYVDNFDAQSAPIRFLVRAVLRRSHYVIAVGEAHRDRVVAVSGIPASRVHVIDMGIWQHDPPPGRSEARQRLNLGHEETIILFIGNLLHRKGADILVQAAARLQAAGYAFTLVIGGQGPEATALLQLIESLELVDAGRLIGTVPPEDVFTWFAAADVCVVPSRTEPFGLVAVEAMYAGAPVVAADVDGLRQTIRHGENGYLFPVADHVTLAKLLIELLDWPDLRERFATAGRRTAEEYDMRDRAERVAALYRRCLSCR